MAPERRARGRNYCPLALPATYYATIDDLQYLHQPAEEHLKENVILNNKPMGSLKKTEPGFVVRLKNEGYAASLEPHKIYPVLPDPEAEKDGDIRIIDESGENYLYPKDWFVLISVPDAFEASLLRTA